MSHSTGTQHRNWVWTVTNRTNFHLFIYVLHGLQNTCWPAPLQIFILLTQQQKAQHIRPPKEQRLIKHTSIWWAKNVNTLAVKLQAQYTPWGWVWKIHAGKFSHSRTSAYTKCQKLHFQHHKSGKAKKQEEVHSGDKSGDKNHIPRHMVIGFYCADGVGLKKKLWWAVGSGGREGTHLYCLDVIRPENCWVRHRLL